MIQHQSKATNAANRSFIITGNCSIKVENIKVGKVNTQSHDRFEIKIKKYIIHKIQFIITIFNSQHELKNWIPVSDERYESMNTASGHVHRNIQDSQ